MPDRLHGQPGNPSEFHKLKAKDENKADVQDHEDSNTGMFSGDYHAVGRCVG
jgi:hypothetical protein